MIHREFQDIILSNNRLMDYTSNQSMLIRLHLTSCTNRSPAVTAMDNANYSDIHEAGSSAKKRG